MKELFVNCFDIDLYDEGESSVYSCPKYKGNIYVTKNPGDIIRVDYLLNHMNNFFVICMLRDPRDSIVSINGHDPGKYWCGLKFWKLYTPYIDKLINHPRFMLVRYEKLVNEPNEVQQEIMEKLPFLDEKIPFSKFCLRAKKDRKPACRPIINSSIGNWKHHLSRVKYQIEVHGSIAGDLIKYGYERDNDWEKILDGVIPDPTPGHFTEYTDVKRLRKTIRYNKIRSLLTMLGHNEFFHREKK